ncbi:MAG: alpha-N-arabinofuranosidase [Clostridia bacterium]|nr:alpha-N-arabinofuranosidase [Clostridia bacterium]
MEKARLTVDPRFPVAPVDKRLFGVFIEPISRIIDGCVYNPDHPTADENGFRGDVLALMRELRPTLIRYPGGNYVSNYHWTDGIGPRADRPVRFDKAWRAVDRNRVGIDEYYDYCRLVGAEPMLAVNLGTGTPEEAANEVEYCNLPGGTAWSELRRKNGHEEPQGIRLWCLGNEMDGPWQVEQKTPLEYGRAAQEAAKMMKWVDPSIELVACGSCTNEPFMPTYPEWDRIVLDNCFDKVEYLSLHRYLAYDPKVGGEFSSPFTIEDLPYITVELGNYIDTCLAAADFIRGKRRSDKKIGISFDEWGVRTSFEVEPEGLSWTEKAVPAGELRGRVANVVDAMIYGSILITFLNRCDRVKIACESIVIGGMIGVDPDGGAYRQTTFFPFMHASAYGRGTVLRPALESPTVRTDMAGELPALQTATVWDEAAGMITVFAVNLGLREPVALENDFGAFGRVTLTEHLQLHEDQPLAGNTLANPDRVAPRSLPVADGPVTLPPLSWNVLRYRVG